MKFWKWTEDQRTLPSASTRWTPLRIESRGMCCSIGHNSAAAIAAINARMNHFRETEFVDGSAPLIGATLYNLPVWGAERLRIMLHTVVKECIDTDAGIKPVQVAVLLLCADEERPGMQHDVLSDDFSELTSGKTGSLGTFHPCSRMYAGGKAGVARIFEEASRLLQGDNAPRYVLLTAVDSLLDAGTIEHYLSDERLSTNSNADGFIPGEGAAAVLLSIQQSQHSALWIEGVATATESWRIGSEQPLRANGLTVAMREAAHNAGISIDTLDFHASGMTGESWYAREVGIAQSRVLTQRKPDFPHHMIASRVGETGAAASILTLAWLSDVMGRSEDSPGRSALLHFSGDDGHRAALVVSHRP